MSKVDDLKAEILSEMLVDCYSRHNYKCYDNCTENAEKLLDQYMEAILNEYVDSRGG